MTTLLLTATLVAMLFVFYALAKHGVPESVSATYYLMGNRGWALQLVLALMAVCLYPVWFSVCRDGWTYLPFLGCASLMFVAFAPCFRMELEGAVHYSSAVVCCVCALLWQLVEGLWDVTLWFAFIGGMLCLRHRKEWCWCLECALIGSLLANLWRIHLLS